MCLAVPGTIVAVHEGSRGALGRSATVEVGGNRLDVSLALLPRAGVGAWVLVHAGMALQEIDAGEAQEIWTWLREIIDSDAAGAAPA